MDEKNGESERPKPVAWLYTHDGSGARPGQRQAKYVFRMPNDEVFRSGEIGAVSWTETPLYTHPPQDEADARRYRFLRDWLVENNLLHCLHCRPSGEAKVGDWWVFHPPYGRDETRVAGFGKTEEEAIDAALAAQEAK